MTSTLTFQPDWTSPPGETIADILEERNLSLSDFASQMRLTPQAATDLLKGDRGITEIVAAKLQRIVGASSEFWMARENQYRKALLHNEHSVALSPQDWLRQLPIADMIKFGWIKSFQNESDKIAACLRFFGVQSVKEWQSTYADLINLPAFRTSTTFKAQPGAVTAWLRQGEIESNSIKCSPWNAEIFREVLSQIRGLTRKRNPQLFLSELQAQCATAGVAVVIVRAPNGCRASGATYFLSPDKAILFLSFRHLSDDHFWFTFFHEAGHLLLHHSDQLILEGDTTSSTDAEEKEANDFSASILIPHEFQALLMSLPLDGREVIRFARKIGISPGIVVGQLQHTGRFKQNQLNNLKTRYNWDAN